MNLYVSLKDSTKKRISISQEIQEELDEYINPSIIEFKENKNHILFDGQYKADEDEILYIDNYSDPLIEQLNIDNETIKNTEIENIKCLILKINNSIFAFQNFDNRKIISNKFSLIFSKETFSKLNNKGIIINKNIDALLYNNQLFFLSFNNVSRIFDLDKFYREISDKEIDELENSGVFSKSLNKDNLDSRIRKKLYLIKRNKILDIVKDKYKDIKTYANRIGLGDCFQNNKIQVPDDKKGLKELINFLNDDLYKSSITDLLYETNSKRKIK